ncbi:RICIN domain-containing protein [Actinomadura sp. DC4]|uniref:RICIN domain-containing protein n=1 Tax=Actinomadura sp. DC4 TaxID=3055069 RepID=UPI0025B04E9F|nr:RICIN domain-containing protein [Actinomadura sp. DC4]MDN3357298.1 RICIN domain-containing protein [Actinomadura sp. DC4]
MSEPTPEQPEEPKRRDLTRAFSAVVRPPGEKKSLSSYLVTIGMTVVLAGAVALGVGAIVFRPHAKDKPVAAADKQHSKTASPAASPRIVYRQPPGSGAIPPAAGVPPATPSGKHRKSAKGGSADGGSSTGGTGSGSSGSGAGSAGGAAQSQAKVMAATSGNFLLGNASHRCIDIAGGRAVNNNYTQIWDCRSGLPQQKWTFVNGTMRSMGMCLTTTGSSAGSALVVQSCNGGSAQLFRHTSANDIVHSGTNKCVDARGDKTAAGTRLQIYTCNGYNNQKWHLA